MVPTLTIFTPTFNRINLLPRLYNSLLNQTDLDFEWLIIDDGSSDGTVRLVKSWQDENKIKINYYHQKNSGKHIAHNMGVEKTNTDLFVCVDSDDKLVDKAVETVKDCWKNTKNDAIGLLFFMKDFNNRPITKLRNREVEYSTLKDAYDFHGLEGDTMLVYLTEVIKMFSFPKFEGEKFVPEAYLYDKLDQVGVLKLVPLAIYEGEYQKDGYTNNMADTLSSNPKGYFSYIINRIEIDKTLIQKFGDYIRFNAMYYVEKCDFSPKNLTDKILLKVTKPLGYLMYLNRYYKKVFN